MCQRLMREGRVVRRKIGTKRYTYARTATVFMGAEEAADEPG